MSATPVVQLLVGVGYTTDITSLLSIKLPVSVTRGRSDEFSDVQPSTMSLSLDISTTTPPASVAVGTPIRLRVTVNGVTTNRFTGVVESTQVTWPKGAEAACVVSVTAVDAMAALNRRHLDSTLRETTRAASPVLYYPMAEPEGSLSVGDLSGNGWPSMTLQQRGTGGTFSLGSGTGPATQQGGSATFERASATAGPYLSVTLSRALPVAPGSYTPGSVSWGFVLSFVVATSTVAAQTFVQLRRPDTEKQDGAPLLGVGCNGSGMLTISSAFKAGFTNTGVSSMIADGLPHHILVTALGVVNGGTGQEVFSVGALVDGVPDPGTSSSGAVMTGTQWPGVTRIDVGGNTLAPMAAASISELCYVPSLGVTPPVAALAPAASTGFTTDRTDQRIARIADWAGITARSLETGAVTATAHQDTTDLSPVAAMNAVAATERGLVFIDGSGQLVFHARSHRYNAWWTAFVGSEDFDESLTFTTDTQSLINRVTVSRPGGATQVFTDTASVAKFGEFPADFDLLYTSDDDAAKAAAWVANTNSTPRPRISTVGVDLLAASPTTAAQMQALELGSLIGMTGLPMQAPGNTVSLFVEGWTENIGLDAWEMQLNTSPNDSPLKLDSAYGALDYWRLV